METLHDRVQAGYLVIKLRVESIVSPAEAKKALVKLFPGILD